MKTVMAKWFECSVAYVKTNEQGVGKRVVEKIVMDALSFSEAETAAVEEMTPYTSGDLEVVAIQIAPYKEVIFSEASDADKYYKVKVAFITFDEKAEKEKRTKMTYLVQACSSENAIANINKAFQGSMSDYAIEDVNGTKILDVYLHEA